MRCPPGWRTTRWRYCQSHPELSQKSDSRPDFGYRRIQAGRAEIGSPPAHRNYWTTRLVQADDPHARRVERGIMAGKGSSARRQVRVFALAGAIIVALSADPM